MTNGRRIGLAVDAVASYGRGVIRGIMTYCRSNPRWMITVEPLWSFGTLPDIREWEVDGLIVQTFSREFENCVLELGTPATNVSNFCQGADNLPTVLPDDAAVGAMGAEYLLSLGFSRLGYCWPGNTTYGALRLAAFRDTAAQAGVEVVECNVTEKDLGSWLAAIRKPIGIMGCNDDWAHRALNLCGRQGIRVPDDVAILGVDNDELFNTLVTPSLSSIAVPAEEIGFQAAAMLERILSGESLDQRVRLLPPLRVVPRESTDVLNVGDPDIVTAIRFIRENAGLPLQVDEVVDAVPLSRRSLERRFRQVLGHSISAEITKAHIERAKLLLNTTDLPMSQIAVSCGLVSSTRLGILFRSATGESPTEYRKRAGHSSKPRKV
jgi:LacI family transcriptional regulator